MIVIPSNSKVLVGIAVEQDADKKMTVTTTMHSGEKQHFTPIISFVNGACVELTGGTKLKEGLVMIKKYGIIKFVLETLKEWRRK